MGKQMMKIPKFDKKPALDLFLDMDGVFANMEKRVKDLTGKLPHEQSAARMWKSVYFDKEFFLSLELMEDAHHLWKYAVQYEPKFLTGAPAWAYAREQKRLWVKKEHTLADGTKFVFDPVEVLVVPRKDKRLHAHPKAILVDDREDNVAMWTDAGGIGVVHRDVWDTIEQLEKIRAEREADAA